MAKNYSALRNTREPYSFNKFAVHGFNEASTQQTTLIAIWPIITVKAGNKDTAKSSTGEESLKAIITAGKAVSRQQKQ